MEETFSRLADTVVEMAAQDRAAGGLGEQSDKALIERRARMEVREYENRTGESLAHDAPEQVARLARKRYQAMDGDL